MDRGWVPVSTSGKGRLALRALEEFGRRPFADVPVGELASRAGVTTGALYHHFDGKLGLYAFVRDEAERRLLDRMEGAAGAREDEGAPEALRAALLIGFDFAVEQAFVRLLGDPHPARERDPVAELFGSLCTGDPVPVGSVVAAAWRAALTATADGIDPAWARAALARLSVRVDPPDDG